MIFIVGVPRSGSTILYQKLTNTGFFAYTDNFTNLVSYESFIGGNYISHRFLRRRRHNCFKSVYGNTMGCGFNAPSEGGKYWKRIRNSKLFNRSSSDFGFIFRLIKKPYILKNLHNSIYIKEICAEYPNVRFIHIIREKTSNINSILNARRNNSIEELQPWSVMPLMNKELKNELELVEFQYDRINNLISESLNGDSRYLKVSYELFIKDEKKETAEIIKFINGR